MPDEHGNFKGIRVPALPFDEESPMVANERKEAALLAHDAIPDPPPDPSEYEDLDDPRPYAIGEDVDDGEYDPYEIGNPD